MRQKMDRKRTSTLASATIPGGQVSPQDDGMQYKIEQVRDGYQPLVMISGIWEDLGFAQKTEADAQAVINSYRGSQRKSDRRPDEDSGLKTDWDD